MDICQLQNGMVLVSCRIDSECISIQAWIWLHFGFRVLGVQGSNNIKVYSRTLFELPGI